MLSLRDTSDSNELKAKGWKNIYHADNNQKRTGAPTGVSQCQPWELCWVPFLVQGMYLGCRLSPCPQSGHMQEAASERVSLLLLLPLLFHFLLPFLLLLPLFPTPSLLPIFPSSLPSVSEKKQWKKYPQVRIHKQKRESWSSHTLSDTIDIKEKDVD